MLQEFIFSIFQANPFLNIHPESACIFSSLLYAVLICSYRQGIQILNFLFCSFMQLAVTSGLLGPDIFPGTQLFSNTLSLCNFEAIIN
jgi:hypothetical protein